MARRRRQERAAEPDPAARDFVIARIGIAQTEARAAVERATRALEAAEEKLDTYDPEAGEPWDEGENDG